MAVYLVTLKFMWVKIGKLYLFDSAYMYNKLEEAPFFGLSDCNNMGFLQVFVVLF